MKIRLLVIGFTMAWFYSTAGDKIYHRTISWNSLEEIKVDEKPAIVRAVFPGARYDDATPGIPQYAESFALVAGSRTFTVKIENEVYDIAPEGFGKVAGIENIGTELNIRSTLGIERKLPFAMCRFIPARINPYNNQFEILVSFDIIIHQDEEAPVSAPAIQKSITSSILANGTWYKFSVYRTGIHRITYNDLHSMGIDPSTLDPRKIRIYGNGGGMLPESLNDFRHEDLVENRIYVDGENDGKFDQQDYILFYGESPNEWKYQVFSQAFYHIQNIYSDSTYYFLNFDLGQGKRIDSAPQATQPANVYVNKFTDYAYHERDLFNLSNIGRVWYGEVFDVNTSYTFNFSFPDIDVSSPAYFRAYIAAKSEVTTSFKFFNGNQEIMSANISGISAGAGTFARPYIGSNPFAPGSGDINIRIDYDKKISSSIGWLNYFEINVVRNLIFSGSQMSFRDPNSVSPGSIAEFTLRNAGQGVKIWQVTDPTNVHKIDASQSGSDLVFRMPQDSIEEYIAFSSSNYFPVSFSGRVENQDLHGEDPADMIIITHPLFKDQAERLADFHRTQDGLKVKVTEIAKVYNEFSSGAQDITAIRNYLKHLYDNAAEGQEPRYLLLFGDASFDYKDIIANNSNFVPTWEEEESLIIDNSIASDDYFGFMDGPGDNKLDIGIGRMPVQTAEEATVAIDKVIHYATNSNMVMKDWRNVVAFVADDEDGNMHFNQAEKMVSFIDTNYSAFNVDKIYVDAFPQVSTPGGQRAPEVNRAINNRIDKGCLVINYTGHGGEVGWGHERFLENSDINSWTNYDRLPVFITATCEFSRYDDPERTSAGEYTYLNPKGGAIAMFTTARATFGSANFDFNMALFEYMFEENSGEYYRFGDLIRLSKNVEGVNGNDKKYLLLGDPALRLAYPHYNVITTKINQEPVSSNPDTLQALKKITIEGEVITDGGNTSSFNGTIYPIVYDKPSQITTLGSDPTSYANTFEIQNNVLYKGKAQVTDGKFSFTFIVPKDIAYQYGFGKISYYAANEVEDAHGFYKNIMVGGLDQSVAPDTAGPKIELFMNNRYFVFGGITDENPDMLAFVSDASGINTVGTGIGHDIVAILDGNTDKPIILNDFYESDLDSYSSGTIIYPFNNLEKGLHTLSIKVWDVFNNSSEAYIEFNVISSEKFMINDLINYPNPFNSSTTFAFSHNYAEGELDVTLRIYSMQGQIVRTLETNLALSGYRSELYEWDGTDDTGVSLAKGMYIYKLLVKNENGQTDEKAGKLILAR